MPALSKARQRRGWVHERRSSCAQQHLLRLGSALTHASLGKVLYNLMLVESSAPEMPATAEHSPLYKDTMQSASGIP